MKLEFEYKNCGFCGSESFKTLYSAPEYSPYSQCSVVKCSNCGLVRTNPRPTQTSLTELYTNEYYSRKIPKLKGLASQVKIFAMKHSFSWLYPRLIPFKIHQNATICDIGCGSGQWLGLMQTAYPDAKLYGYEIDKETASIAAKLCRGEVHHGDFLDNSWSSESFDFITFWDVFEHVDNPKTLMEEVARLLKPNGIVVILYPNFNSIYSKIFKQFWWALLFNQHLYHFSRETLTQVLKYCKLEPVYFSMPLIRTHLHWNIINHLENMRFKGSTKTSKSSKYILLSILAKLIAPLDKLQVTRFLSQHSILCATKHSISKN
jgi:2-polyprenyl-3-methyl-5-hydroxy-6-metoxy-1,4-benzoquinol methylase